ncbi:hypothetical protein AAVH_15730 [Aphelenchoides avenae]|nr:hypothetical protein AAVH_15730 [Aphelenchus avenae]
MYVAALVVLLLTVSTPVINASSKLLEEDIELLLRALGPDSELYDQVSEMELQRRAPRPAADEGWASKLLSQGGFWPSCGVLLVWGCVAFVFGFACGCRTGIRYMRSKPQRGEGKYIFVESEEHTNDCSIKAQRVLV